MSQGPGFVVRLRGLPWSASKDEITRFLVECNIAGGEEGIHFTFSREGRPSGEAFVELEAEDDVVHALAQNHEHIGSRYIEVFRVDRSEMEYTIKHSGAGAAADQRNPDAVLKLRGLPFGCSKEEISQFFQGCLIVPNGIMLPEERPGRSTGEAYVQFSSPEESEKALKKHNERIGHRYIEIFKSSLSEANANTRGMIRPMMLPRPGPYDRGDRGFGVGAPMGPIGMNMGFGRGRGRNLKGEQLDGFYEEEYDDFMGFGMRDRRRGGMTRGGGRGGMGMGAAGMMDRARMPPGSLYISKTGHSVHMRGLPYNTTNEEVFKFFAPIQPVRCEFEYGDNGRPTGEANVDFVSHQEALDAMKKHKKNIQHRYIELFLNSEPVAARGNSGAGGGYGNGMGGGFGNSEFTEDIGPGFGSGGGFGGGYGGGSGSQGNGGGFGQGGAGGYAGQGGMNSYDLGGGYGDGLGGSGGMRNSNYSAF